MKLNNKYIIIISTIIVVIILLILIKPLWFRNQLIKNFKKNGIDLQVQNFEMSYFNNSFKMSVKASSDFLYADINEFSGEYNFETIYSNVPEFKSIYIKSGNIEILRNIGIEKKILLPEFIYIEISNVKIKFKEKIAQEHLLILEEILYYDFGKLAHLSSYEDSRGKLKYDDIGFNLFFNSLGFYLGTEEFTKTKLNKLNIPFISLINTGQFKFGLNVKSNSNSRVQNISALLTLKDFSIKTDKEINFIEKLFYSNIKDKYKTKEPISEEIKIEFELPLEKGEEFLSISNADKIKSALLIQISKQFLK